MPRFQFSLMRLLVATALVGYCIVTVPFWSGRVVALWDRLHWRIKGPTIMAKAEAERDAWIKRVYGSRENYEAAEAEHAAFKKRLAEEAGE